MLKASEPVRNCGVNFQLRRIARLVAGLAASATIVGGRRDADSGPNGYLHL